MVEGTEPLNRFLSYPTRNRLGYSIIPTFRLAMRITHPRRSGRSPEVVRDKTQCRAACLVLHLQSGLPRQPKPPGLMDHAALPAAIRWMVELSTL